MLNITSKIELNIEPQTPIDPIEIADFSKRWQIPSIVVHPAMFHHISMAIATRHSKSRIGMTLDFPKGDNFGTNKASLLPGEAQEAAFFDILLGKDRSEADYKNEIKFITSFIKSMNPLAEIRFTLDMAHRDPENIDKILKVLKAAPCSWIRTNHFTGQKNIDHDAHINKIREVVAIPIKVSGGIGIDEILKYSSNKNIRFDMSFNDAKNLVKKLNESDKAIAVNANITKENKEGVKG